jgi:ABC-type molybdate transport system substrate-binding protein
MLCATRWTRGRPVRDVMRALAVLAAALALAVPAAAAEITVLCARDVQQAVATVAEEFQVGARQNVWFSYGTAEEIANRARKEDADVVVARAAAVAELEAKGAVRPGTRVVFGNTRAGAGREPVAYAAAVLLRSSTPNVAIAFVAYLKSEEARALLKAAGIDPAD